MWIPVNAPPDIVFVDIRIHDSLMVHSHQNQQKGIAMKSLLSIVIALVLSVATMPSVAAAEQKAVLVTGASTGIGRNLAERLASEGHFVFAGARKEEDLADLDSIENIKAVRLDVTSQEDIDAAVEVVRKQGLGLWGLVNNAGVATAGPLAQTPDSDLDFVFDVNVAGVLRVTRAFAPMIIESGGRIATTGSISGTLSSPTFGVYSMSKHAIEAFTDSLAGEMAPQGVTVSVIEPGNYKSRIRRTAVARVRENLEAAGVDVDPEMDAMMTGAEEREVTYKEPDEVSDAFMHALFSDEPQRRYMVVPNEEEARVTIAKQIEELVQLNAMHAYKFDRDELVAMLDRALAE
jgi:NAD(P)-dependent dehydrogenase (short-subunit alcohol dehydrogenase family)